MAAGNMPPISRRTLLKAALSSCSVGPLLASCGGNVQSHVPSQPLALDHAPMDPDLIRRENLRPGTLEWLVGRTRRSRPCRTRCPWIEGFCSHTSVEAGETIDFFVSTRQSVAEYTLDIFRMGFYGGTGGRLMTHLGPLPGRRQPDPPVGRSRVRECAWEPSISFTIPPDWISGVYLGKLTTVPDGFQSYLIFIVRDRRKADYIVQCSDFTWQAYNHWPGRYSLYSHGKRVDYWGPETAVSFDRPYAKHLNIVHNRLSVGSGEWFLWEFPMAYWLEAHGHDVTYISNLDTHAGTALFSRAHGFLSVGHDEYYTIEMYDNLRHAISEGLSVGFFSGNVCCGRIGLRESSQGRPARIFSRVDRFGRLNERELKYYPAREKFPWQSPDESLLIGARNVSPMSGVGDWICSAPDHWLYRGTRMRQGDRIPGLVGWEYHSDPAPFPDLEVVATGPVSDERGPGIYAATVHPGPKGNFVFNASSCWWADGLSEPPGYVRPRWQHGIPPGPDRRVQRMTENVLERMKRPHGSSLV